MNDISLYIHWPFCEKKCPYCDFNSHILPADLNEQAYKDAFIKELSYFRRYFGPGRLVSIFFGGGTPSLMSGAVCEAILSHISALWSVADDCEITLEANPSSAEITRFKAYRAAGVNRLSLGIQALNDHDLQILGRKHNLSEAKRALAWAGELFPRFSFDLIYGRPQQRLEQWQEELAQALTFAKGHISLYQLTIAKGTEFYRAMRRGELRLAAEQAADFFNWTHDFMRLSGMPPYEISNFAQRGEESQHNLRYWRYQSYIGVGPGAHSRLIAPKQPAEHALALTMEYNPKSWLTRHKQRHHAIKLKQRLTRLQMADEALLMGLRLFASFDLKSYQKRYGIEIKAEILSALEQQNLLQQKPNGFIEITHYGRLFLDYIIVELARNFQDLAPKAAS